MIECLFWVLGGYAKFTGLKTYNKNLKTMLAIGGWNEGSSRFSPMVADPKRRKEFVKNSVKFLRQNHFDGLDLDWEYPAFRDGGKPRDRNNYADLVQVLHRSFVTLAHGKNETAGNRQRVVAVKNLTADPSHLISHPRLPNIKKMLYQKF